VSRLGRHLFTGEITTIGSDHCCYDLEQSTRVARTCAPCPTGLPGVENRLPMIFSEYVVGQGLPVTRSSSSPRQSRARERYLPAQGHPTAGADADIAIWDATAQWTVTSADLHMATDYTPYEGSPRPAGPPP